MGVPRDTPHTAMGWEVEAHDLYELLMWLDAEYAKQSNTDLVITENGAAYEDEPNADGFVNDSADRLVYIRDHLGEALRACQDGARLVGYLVWSLLDNFDYKTLQRTPKASALWLSQVAKDRQLLIPQAD